MCILALDEVLVHCVVLGEQVELMDGRSVVVVAAMLLVSGAHGSSKSSVCIPLLLKSVLNIVTIRTIFLHTVLEPQLFTISPMGGSVTAFEYQQHIQLECRITEGGEVRQTLWTLQNTSNDLAGGSYVYIC